MPEVNTIELIDLLREREAEFVKIWKCEQEIIGILGMPNFPFPAPPDLPSRHAGKTVKAPKKAASPKTPSQLVRALVSPQENAYRITYRRDGVEESSFQTDQSLVSSLLRLSKTTFQVLSVETVHFRGMEDWTKVDSVWNAGASPSATKPIKP
ncbi:MAG: hypothetical protein IJJ26_02860 [Victivallales bacterium]|nr:hypothetical protein [Victivallales bacterium]